MQNPDEKKRGVMVDIAIPASPGGRTGWLERDHIIAQPQFSRWLVPPAALAIHLCIGMAYGFSVFWLPMSHLLPSAPMCSHGFFAELSATDCNWSVADVTHIFETFIAILGPAAALWGVWLEHAGPRKSGLLSALCWGGGLIIGGYGVAIHQLWLVYLGTGFIGGIGQGLGYITPVSTLIKWFPDRRGMATGLAIMGYGAGAMIGSPLAVWLMARFGRGGIPGVAATLVTMGLLYFVVMLVGAFGFRVAPAGWQPRTAGFVRSAAAPGMISAKHVHLNVACRTPQFWLIWMVLFLNVTAGIALIAMASPMLQEVFGGRLLGLPAHAALTMSQKAAIAAAAAGLVGLISLFNSLGRLLWASASDYLGRKNTYCIFFIAGMLLYALLPTWGHLGLAALFVISVCLIITMYGGGSSSSPAYLADIFGTQMVGAIHGRLITAWSLAGVAGPALIASLRQRALAHGMTANLVYDRTLYILVGLLVIGLICNLLVRPVHPRHHMSEQQLAQERDLQREGGGTERSESAARGRLGPGGYLAWLAVAVPFLIALYIALEHAAALF